MSYLPEQREAFAARLASWRGKSLAVLGHLRPDGDCIGSQVGLVRVLRAAGYEATAVNEHAVPRVLESFVGDTGWELASAHDPSDRTPITVDCADHARIGETLKSAYPQIDTCIDHHLSNTGYAEHNLILPTHSAAAEILTALLLDAGLEIDAVAAQALYIGIATDTGQFCYESTTAMTFALCGELMERGANPGRAAYELYEQESVGKLRLLGRFLESLDRFGEGRICAGRLPAGTYEACEAEIDDSEGLVNYARCLQGVEIGALLEQRGPKVKGSLRAKDSRLRVDLLAARFGGGGHACAAGFGLDSELEAFYPEFRQAALEHLQTQTG